MLSIEKKFNFSEKQCLKTVTTLLKPKKVGIEIKKKGKRINIWQVIKNLRNLEKKINSNRRKNQKD